MPRIGAGLLGLWLCASGLAAAQETRTIQAPAPGTTEMRRVSQILGSTVQLNDGSGFGKVEDIVIGPDNQIDYLVVSHQGQYAMFPWTAGRFDFGQRVVTYDVTPQTIQPLLFAPDAWPNTADPAFNRRIQTVFPRAVRREIRRESLRPVPEAPRAVPPGPGAVVVPPGNKVKIERDGDVKIKK
jgi:sporulation protein YlmC with PRC-barrel domain